MERVGQSNFQRAFPDPEEFSSIGVKVGHPCNPPRSMSFLPVIMPMSDLIRQVSGFTLSYADYAINVAMPMRQEFETGELTVNIAENQSRSSDCEKESCNIRHRLVEWKLSPDECG